MRQPHRQITNYKLYEVARSSFMFHCLGETEPRHHIRRQACIMIFFLLYRCNGEFSPAEGDGNFTAGHTWKRG
jgi:hypothetical protein